MESGDRNIQSFEIIINPKKLFIILLNIARALLLRSLDYYFRIDDYSDRLSVRPCPEHLTQVMSFTFRATASMAIVVHTSAHILRRK